MTEKIKITYFTQPNTTGYIVATFGVHIVSWDLYLSKLKLIRKKDGGLFIAPPSEEYRDPKTGEKKFANFFWFGDKTERFFQSECLKAIKNHCESKNDVSIFG